MVDGVHYTEESFGNLVGNLNFSLSSKGKLEKKKALLCCLFCFRLKSLHEQ
jgi:hypothetical protein